MTDQHHLLVSLWHVLSAAQTCVFVHYFDQLKTNKQLSRTELAKSCHTQIRNRLESLSD